MGKLAACMSLAIAGVTLLLAVTCRSPDYVETSIAQGQGTIDGTRANDYTQDTQSFMLTTGWSIGQQGQAMKNLAALDVSKAGVLRTDTYQAPAPIIVEQHGHDEADPEAEGLGKLYAALGSVVVILGGLFVTTFKKKPPEGQDL
jgi:hypothetical protein